MKYQVKMSRTCTQYATISIEANSPEEAGELAEEEAGNHEFSGEHEADYDILYTLEE
jgi:hypothetical protein